MCVCVCVSHLQDSLKASLMILCSCSSVCVCVCVRVSPAGLSEGVSDAPLLLQLLLLLLSDAALSGSQLAGRSFTQTLQTLLNLLRLRQQLRSSWTRRLQLRQQTLQQTQTHLHTEAQGLHHRHRLTHTFGSLLSHSTLRVLPAVSSSRRLMSSDSSLFWYISI